MAKNPDVDDTGAVALRPPRVNIFARPATSTAERPSPSQPKTIFDPAAACQPSEGDDRDHRADAPRLRLAGIARLVAIAGLALVIALVALQPSGTATVDRSRPSVHRQHARPSSGGDKRAREQTPVVTRRPRPRPRPRKRAKPHRLPRPHRRHASTPPGAMPRPRINPRPAPPPPVPRRSAPTGPLPAPVSPTSPPEFM